MQNSLIKAQVTFFTILACRQMKLYTWDIEKRNTKRTVIIPGRFANTENLPGHYLKS